MQQNFFKNKNVIILLHIAAWIIILSLPYLLIYTPARGNRPPQDRSGFFYLSLFTDVCWIGLFYLNLYVLTPKLFILKKYFLFAATLIGAFTVILTIHWILFDLLITRPFILMNSVGFNLLPFILTAAVSTTYYMIQERSTAEKLLLQKQQQNLKTELSFLRSQISPHFLFNVLNNMLALSRLKSDQLEPTIFKLSSLMRYMLYETDEEKVPLKKEMEYLQSYIDLQRQRLGKNVIVNISMQSCTEHYFIAPMLLIPFIENAFKHGIGNITGPQIDIELQTKKDTLHFIVRNKFSQESAEIKDKTSGIGLANVKRRLEILYEKNYSLLISEKNNWFIVSLQLNLQ
jgi:two-component system, LytTR family, sensor kinase